MSLRSALLRRRQRFVNFQKRHDLAPPTPAPGRWSSIARSKSITTTTLPASSYRLNVLRQIVDVQNSLIQSLLRVVNCSRNRIVRKLHFDSRVDHLTARLASCPPCISVVECLTDARRQIADRVRRMFGQIAGRYDFLNHLLSLSIDRYWRWRTVRLVPPRWAAADSRRLHRHRRPGAGLRPGGRRQDADRRRRFLPRDAGDRPAERLSKREPTAASRSSRPTRKSLPLPADTFQIVCVAFGLRNVADTDRGLAEMDALLRRAAASPCWNSRRPRGSRSRRSTAGIFATCCRASANCSRATRATPTNICRRASASFRKAKRSSSGCAPPASTTPPLPAHFRRGYTVCRKKITAVAASMTAVSADAHHAPILSASASRAPAVRSTPCGYSRCCARPGATCICRSAPRAATSFEQELDVRVDLQQFDAERLLRAVHERRQQSRANRRNWQRHHELGQLTIITARTSWPRWPAARSSPAAW